MRIVAARDRRLRCLCYQALSSTIRAFCYELGVTLDDIPIEVHEVPSDYGRVNPVNRILALVSDGGELIYDSRVICEYEYIDASHRSPFLPREGPAR